MAFRQISEEDFVMDKNKNYMNLRNYVTMMLVDYRNENEPLKRTYSNERKTQTD